MEFQYRREADFPATNRTSHDPALIPFWHLPYITSHAEETKKGVRRIRITR